MAKRKPRKTKSADQVLEDASDRLRSAMVAAGVPEHRVAGERIRQFKSDTFADLRERRQVIRLVYSDIVDRWLAEGGDGFEEPSRAALNHCRGLWEITKGPSVIANYGGMNFGSGDRESYLLALKQLGEYEKDIPRCYWKAFELVAREGWSAADAGAHLAMSAAQASAQAKAATGMCLSLVAMWRKY